MNGWSRRDIFTLLSLIATIAGIGLAFFKEEIKCATGLSCADNSGSTVPTVPSQPTPAPTPEKPQPANQTSSQTEEMDPAQAWRLAINKSTSAAELTQTAQTKADWETLASKWSEAIELMKIVPSDHPEYERAQQKIVEYQRNLEYAQRVAASRP
ncbi:MAG: hypothetical protein GDA48_08620 [Hormoscilla sp. GM102CHS1]|nr:hypothetical protein [Hormoscilla sp. GM102CHS1]